MGGTPDTELDAALDRLVAAGAVDERPDGTVTTTSDFEATRRVYRDSYANADDATFRRTVAETFGVDEATAADRIETGEITRDDLVAYLSARSFLDDVDAERLAVMASLLVELGPGSPVPDSLTELDDDSWAAFIDDHPDAVVTVWKHDCAPCESLKEDLDELRAAIPDGVAVAGVDGESVPAFRRTHDVDTAPAVCCFRDGDLVAVVTGRQSVSAYAERFADCY